ncbi:MULTISPECIES: hypothetical protein [Clostridium]|uniref:A nuclease of the HNH/ENDO VII superfamily with conserved WHH n=1 Tax=Clostridium frigoriphilum TaxID=443253 RepID=A0ABU7UVI4_9CLOT|nr:hypothetical protein [Clostridium sp. DSM 17811]MBU3102437.1 hypothetical protein [Clostridium sp. DSM 17811]
MMEDIGDDIKYCYNRLNDNKDDLKNIYDKKIVPYENKDDEYSNKAGKLYFKYTNTWESIVDDGKDFGITGINFGKGLFNLGADVLKGGYGLAKGAVVIAGAGVGVAMKSMMETGDAPDCLKTCITKTEGYGKTVSEVLKDPIIIAEGMAQSASDTVEEKGIAYSTSYVVGGLLLTKGLNKASSVSKVWKAVDVSRIDYLREKYGKLSPAKLHSEINRKELRRIVGNENPSKVAQSWQGGDPYFGVDIYRDIKLKPGKIIYAGVPRPTGYLTTKLGIDRVGNDATKVFKGLQVKPFYKDVMDMAEYRNSMMAYEPTIDVNWAFGITKANPQFGDGKLPQIFIQNFNELVDNGYFKKIPEKAIKLQNYKMPLDDYDKIIEKIIEMGGKEY